MADLVDALAEIVGVTHAESGSEAGEDYAHDEALTGTWQLPAAVVHPGDTAEVAAVVRYAAANGIPLTARGSGTGLSGACVPRPDGILVAFDRMADLLEVDTDNHVAVVQPGVTLDALHAATEPHGLLYPVFPGESSASLGGNVATNAGGMRAVRYGVTRHQVLGLTAVLGTGEVIRTGGKFVKATSGYDLTQLVIGSEGTLALVTEATLRLHPLLAHGATILAPYASLAEVAAAVPRIVGAGLEPSVVEYIDTISMAGITANADLDLGVPGVVQEQTAAYLVVVVQNRDATRMEQDAEELSILLADLGAIDVYVLPASSGAALIAAREKAFWASKAAGADDLVDMVVPRASIPAYLETVGELANETGSLVVGCGHAGDGNVHLSVFQPDPAIRSALLHRILGAGAALGGAVSGEHGIGVEKKEYYVALEDPAKLDLMRRIKSAFDPAGVLNPGTIFDGEQVR